MAVDRAKLLEFLRSKTRADLSAAEDTTELFSSGLVDSFAMIDLLFWLEQQTGARVAPEDVSVDNLDTIERILGFAASRE